MRTKITGLLAVVIGLLAGAPDPAAGAASTKDASLVGHAGLALIPAGTYTPPQPAPGTSAAIKVPAFYLEVRPVTNAEFLAFVRANPAWRRSRVSPLFADAGYLGDWASDLDLGPGAPPGSPVVRVSWFAARAYAGWRGRRLPSTAEWERAALAGFATDHGMAERAYREAVIAWYSEPFPTPLPTAGAGRPNVYGVRNLVDLVWEWVDDFNAGSGAEASSCGGGAAGVGDFSDYAAFMRAAFRGSLHASYVVPNLGFRCALSP